MIDFRYHLVSIASVFLALAVGIVLGAGPLKGTLGDTLASEVAQLRSDADSLRGELADAEAGVSTREEVLAALRPRSTAGLLAGSSMSILALPGSPDAAVEATRVTLTEAGAGIAAEVRVDESWTSEDPPDVTDRTAAAAELRELLAGDLPVGIAPERVIALALGWALATDPTAGSSGTEPVEESSDEPAESAEPTPDTATIGPSDAQTGASSEQTPESDAEVESGTSARILEILAANGLLTLEGEDAPALTDGVVVVAPVTGDAAAESVTVWSDLVAAIDEAGAVLVAGDVTGEPDPETHLIEAIRASSDLSGRISTLDNLVTAVGDAGLPFAVYERLAGQSGHYGALGSAARFFPPVPADGAP